MVGWGEKSWEGGRGWEEGDKTKELPGFSLKVGRPAGLFGDHICCYLKFIF